MATQDKTASAAQDKDATATDSFDFVIIGAGTAGEASANLARARGATVAVADSELFGGSCPYWACMPSKSLLHSADVHAAGGDYEWPKASDRRDYMISREGTDWPDDGGHVRALEKIGAVAIRGKGRIAGPGTVVVTGDDGERTLTARHIIVAVGSHATTPPIDGLDTITPWTNREATATRTLPDSLVIIGTGPTGVELAQVFARYGVPTTLLGPQDTINPKDHPRNSEIVAASLRRRRRRYPDRRARRTDRSQGRFRRRACRPPVGRIDGRGSRGPPRRRPFVSSRGHRAGDDRA